jgi:hypothetical protein
MSNAAPSRIEEARRRALTAKQAAAALAAAGFLAVLVLARGSHPGQSNASPGTSGSAGTQSGEESSDDSFEFGSGSVAPSTGTPQVQTSVS